MWNSGAFVLGEQCRTVVSENEDEDFFSYLKTENCVAFNCGTGSQHFYTYLCILLIVVYVCF